ncbi:MAG TPA: anthranilate synthase component I [Candidatus Dormibacteraeota bacterium]|nr:anthranilate synthase component I [Candidatus Dormibacteraeota bacterium]
MKAQITPSMDEFSELARRGNVVPIFAEFIADNETPVSAFKKLDCGGYSFLFESTEKNDESGRFSFVGADPRIVIRIYRHELQITELREERRVERTGDPLDELRKLIVRYQFVSRPELPRFSGGAVGFLGYEAIHFFEPKVPAAERDELKLPEMIFMITGSLLIFDHRLRTLKIVANAFLEDGPLERIYARASDSIHAIMRQLAKSADLPLVPAADREIQPAHSNFHPEEFERAVERAKDYIRAGDIFQVVLSQRFESEFSGDALDFYRCLRFINPSPYMFCLKFGADFALVGSSPEMHVRLIGDAVEIRPLAGTRPRGLTSEQDERNAAELLADPKERAEHVMLVDLARNDVGRVSDFGTVRVTELMEIERYSHVMHIVSNVTGRLRTGCTGFDLVRATFPAGTVSGAPKIRAMQIISELESTRRGCYAGAIGYFGFDGNVDSCIALRCAVLKDGKAYFQAGAGIVADSSPRSEYEETVNKAHAMAKALSMATRITPSRKDKRGCKATEVGDFELRELTLRLMRGENLSRGEAGNFLGCLLNPITTDAQIAAALTSLAVKGETFDELAGIAEAMRNRALPLRSCHTRFIDTAGTGSSTAKTFNVSTAAAFVIAGAGLPVAKHGSRAATSRCGSADVLQALGVNTAAPPETVERCLNEHEICFIFAPLFHAAAARVADVRRELGVHTTFNLLGPLTNPAQAPFQIVGVWHRSLLERVASALTRLSVEKAWVVHGADGLDEITIADKTYVAACSSTGQVETFTLSPDDFGLERQHFDEFRGKEPQENAQLIRAILKGEKTKTIAAARDLVIANAAAALHLAGVAPNLRSGASLARESIDSGQAASKLDVLVRETNRKP